MPREITPRDVKARLDAGERITLIDVREAWEVRRSQLKGAIHIPMNDIPDSLDRIPKEGMVVFVCHHGGRSMQVAQWLAFQGFQNLYNLAGGIERWSMEVDPSVPRY